MKKDPGFERRISDHLMYGLIIMEPYGDRGEEPGNFLHIFRISLQFADEQEPFEGVAFIPIPFDGGTEDIPDITFDEGSMDFSENFPDYDKQDHPLEW